jgi:hypothetical protein
MDPAADIPSVVSAFIHKLNNQLFTALKETEA